MANTTDGADESLYCDQCGAAIEESEAIRTETMGDLDPDRWQTLCCPGCGRRLKTVFTGLEDP